MLNYKNFLLLIICEIIYNAGSSIKGPITRAIDINSCDGKEFIAIASAKGELRASVVMVRLTYSGYVNLIFLDKNKSITVFTAKKIINGMNMIIIEFRFSNNNFPCPAKIQNTASDKKHI